ncbi:putative type III secretion translocator domain protein [Chlamydia psittaci 84/55]|nr:putative type III secretion translocator domain protein [Chlamydia psittaci 84/55]
MQQIEKSIEKEQQAQRWGSLATIVEWILPWATLGASTVSVIMGGGIFSWIGVLSGLIALTLTLLDALNGWEAIEKLIPGKDRQTKQKILKIVRIVLFVIAVLLSIATLKLECLGLPQFVQGVLRGITPALEGALSLLRGAMLWTRSKLFKMKSHYVFLETKIELLSLERDDYIARTQEILESFHDSFENLAHVLQLCREIDRTFLESLR